MKYASFLLICIAVPLFVSCGISENRYYAECFFLGETTFDIQGEVFTNDSLTQKSNFEQIAVKTDAVRGWEIAGVHTTGNKFQVTVNAAANGITLSKDAIVTEDESYARLIFYVDGRAAKGAFEPEFNKFYEFVYVPEAVDLSVTDFSVYEGIFGDEHNYYYYDLNFVKPGWYKIYYSEDTPIGNKASYLSGANTKIRSPL